MQTVVLNFSMASEKLELGLDPDFSVWELLAREGVNYLVISPGRRHLSKVRACTLAEETAVVVNACHLPLIYHSLRRDNHGFLMRIMFFTVSLPGLEEKGEFVQISRHPHDTQIGLWTESPIKGVPGV